MSKAQTELESLWAMLKMPLDQKLDMAIKYGSAKFAAKVDLVSCPLNFDGKEDIYSKIMHCYAI